MRAELQKAHEVVCLALWAQTYKINDSDVFAADRVSRFSEETALPEDSAMTLSQWAISTLFGVKWLHCGRVQLVTSHKYAAAVMSSDVKESLAQDMIVPWKAFSVGVPQGALDHGELQFQRIDVGCYEGLPFGCCMTLCGTRGNEGNVQFSRVAGDPAAMFFAGDGEFLGDPGRASRDLDIKERAMRLAIRLVTGLLYTMQHTDNFRKTGAGHGRSSGRDGPPKHRVYFVGAPIKLDCRPDVQRYLAGEKKAPPSVQCLVRGHYKRQVIGVGRGGRKVIWVEPYWRGPEEAPIRARPYTVGK